MHLLDGNKEEHNAAARKVSKSTIFSLQTIPQKPRHSVMQFHLFEPPSIQKINLQYASPIPDASSAENWMEKKKTAVSLFVFSSILFFFLFISLGKRGKFSFVRFDGQKLLSSNKTRQQKTRKIDFNDDELAFRVCVLDSFESSVFSDPFSRFFQYIYFVLLAQTRGKLDGGAKRLNVINFWQLD